MFGFAQYQGAWCDRRINSCIIKGCYNDFHNILSLFDILPSFTFPTSERMLDCYLSRLATPKTTHIDHIYELPQD